MKTMAIKAKKPKGKSKVKKFWTSKTAFKDRYLNQMSQYNVIKTKRDLLKEELEKV